jgi:hypothetical protein|tara:strand:+ start:483 stop:704 length:222 start_codon:yes stop_codon:yes gene_type:complete
MVAQMLQISEFFHNGYIFAIQNSTTAAVVERRTCYRERLVWERAPLHDQLPTKITQQRIRATNHKRWNKNAYE